MSSRLRRDASPRASFFSFLDIITSVTGVLILITLLLSTDLGELAPQPVASPHATGDEALNTILRAQSQAEARNALQRRLIAAAATAGPLPEIEAQVAASKRELASLASSAVDASARSASLRNGQKQQDAALGIDELRVRLSDRRATLANLAQTNELIQVASAGLEARNAAASNRLARARALRGQSWLRPDDGNGKSPQVILLSALGAELKPLDQRSPGWSWNARSAAGKFRDFCATLDASGGYIVFLIRPSGIALFEELAAVARERGIAIGYDAITENQIIRVGQPSLDETTVDAPALPGGGNEATSASSAPGAGQQASGTVSTASNASASSVPAAVGPSSTNQPTSITNQPGAAPPPLRPIPPPKPKSWWERLVEFVQGLFAPHP